MALPIDFRYQLKESDIDSVRNIAASSGFFRDDEVDVATDLVRETIAKGAESGYHFIFAESGDNTIGFCCFGPIPCTLGAFDLYWIALHDRYRGKGIGKLLLLRIEEMIAEIGGRVIYIETSGLSRYNPTRSFYTGSGYKQVACLKDFYQEGDDKIVYEKRL